MIIDGKKIAEELLVELKQRPTPKKFLAAVLVGGDPASASFVAQKEKTAKELGVNFRVKKLEADIAESALIKTLNGLGEDKDCGGIILQLPLPAHLNRESVIKAIPIEKDVDALRGGDLVLPPAVSAVQEILKIENCKIENLTVAVVGMGFLVGQPVARWLAGKTKKLITLDIGDDLARLKDASLVILGVGKAGLVKPEMLKNDALVVDFGYSKKQMADGKERMVGDFESPSSHFPFAIRYTPVPGGTGPILVAKLFKNFYALNL